MTRWLKIAGIVALALASAFWLIVSSRVLAVPLFVASVVSVALRRGRAHPAVPFGLWLAFVGSTWLPFDVTVRTAPDGPKFVDCCPGSWGRGHEAAVAMQRRGECVLCSDVSAGFEPRYYLVW